MKKKASKAYVCSVCGRAGHNRRSCGKALSVGSVRVPVVGAGDAVGAGSCGEVSDISGAWERVNASGPGSEVPVLDVERETVASDGRMADRGNAETGGETFGVEDLETWWALSTSGKRGKRATGSMIGQEEWTDTDTERFCAIVSSLPDNRETFLVLKKFFRRFGVEAKNKLAVHDRTPEHIVAVLSEDQSVEVRSSVALREVGLPQRIMLHLARDPSFAVREELAGNPTVPGSVVKVLFDGRDDVSGRRKLNRDVYNWKIAKHPNCPPDVLQHYMGHGNEFMLCGVVSNPKVTADQIGQVLDTHPDAYSVVAAAVSNPNITGAVVDRQVGKIIGLRERRLEAGRARIVKSRAEEDAFVALLAADRGYALASGGAVGEVYGVYRRALENVDWYDYSEVLTLLSAHPNASVRVLEGLNQWSHNSGVEGFLGVTVVKRIRGNVKAQLEAKRDSPGG